MENDDPIRRKTNSLRSFVLLVDKQLQAPASMWKKDSDLLPWLLHEKFIFRSPFGARACTYDDDDVFNVENIITIIQDLMVYTWVLKFSLTVSLPPSFCIYNRKSLIRDYITSPSLSLSVYKV